MDVSFELQMLGKVIIAALLGGIVGLEREFAERPAGCGHTCSWDRPLLFS
jgi:uncharacterized membrane protein YhiD involved in acid resistance